MADMTQIHSDPAMSASGVPASPISASSTTSHLDSLSSPPIAFISGDYPGEVVVPSSAHTLEGFRQWALSEDCPNRGRFTFAAGELIIDMSPESIENHNFVKTEVTTVVYARAKRHKLGRVYSDGCLLSNVEANISTEPDTTFATYDTLRSGRCQVLPSRRPGVTQEIVGSPDWVLEIVSPSSKRKDKQLLREGYFRAGIGEYWLIDALGDEIDYQILIPGEDGYVAVETRKGWLASRTFGCSFRLTRKKDEDELWQYTLHVRENR